MFAQMFLESRAISWRVEAGPQIMLRVQVRGATGLSWNSAAKRLADSGMEAAPQVPGPVPCGRLPGHPVGVLVAPLDNWVIQ